jgi:hypothetical protein
MTEKKTPTPAPTSGSQRVNPVKRQLARVGADRWVSSTARQDCPGLGLMGPPPTIVFSSICQTEAWPLVFWRRMSAPFGAGSDRLPCPFQDWG